MKKILSTLIIEQSFITKWYGVFFNPFYIARSNLLRCIKKSAPLLSGSILDVGCGSMPYRHLFSVNQYIGLDIDSPQSRERGVASFYYDGNNFPFDDCVFDSVICSQVLEHVFKPEQFITEINRVLKPGGKLLITVPFVWDEHEQPYDYARYTTFGLAALLKGNGFKILIHERLGDDASIIFQLINAYIFKITLGLNKYNKFIITFFIMGFINIMGAVSARILPKSPDLFLDQYAIAERPM